MVRGFACVKGPKETLHGVVVLVRLTSMIRYPRGGNDEKKFGYTNAVFFYNTYY